LTEQRYAFVSAVFELFVLLLMFWSLFLNFCDGFSRPSPPDPSSCAPPAVSPSSSLLSSHHGLPPPSLPTAFSFCFFADYLLWEASAGAASVDRGCTHLLPPPTCLHRLRLLTWPVQNQPRFQRAHHDCAAQHGVSGAAAAAHNRFFVLVMRLCALVRYAAPGAS
jgi:hypothetical protein